MPADTSAAPAVTLAAPTEAPTSEAQKQITSLLGGARAKVSVDVLVEHLVALYGDAGFPILRAAAEAVLRRLQIVAEERLTVLSRPRSGWRGDYRTRRRQRQQRPYRTRLHAVTPLDCSCDCPDFAGNSLGLCKHVLTVLIDLARRPRTLQAARQLGRARIDAPALRWQPIKPLDGDGDWLRRVELLWPSRATAATAAWRAARRHFAPDGEGRLWPTHLHAAEPKARLSLLDTLDARRRTEPGGGDPALQFAIAGERERLQTAILLQPLVAAARRLRGFRRKLYAYQLQGVQRFLATGRLLLADDMGLGKTTQAVAACHLLAQQQQVERGLLVVPAPLKQQWLREWRACTALPLTEVDGPPEQRAACYRQVKQGFLLVNYEQLLRDVDLARRWRPDLVLLDEAQRIKNWETRTAATIKQLEPRFRLVLTGTPFENRLVELDSILEWIDRRPLQPLWRLLPLHRCEDGLGLRHLDVLRTRLAAVLLRRRRQEVLDQLPGRADTRIDVPLTRPQREQHDDLLQPIAQLLKISERRPLTQAEFLRLMVLFTEQRVLANGIAQYDFEDVWPGIQKAAPSPALLDGLSMPKLGELRLLLQQLVVDQGRKVVVFSQWRRALQLAAWATAPLLKAAGLRHAFFTGAQSARRRNENLVAFHDEPAMRVLFATDAGGVGLNLQHAASCCVHFDLPWNPAVFEQRVGRIWRLGQTEKVEVYSLVGEACIESRMAEVLGSKQAAFHAVFDGDGDEVRFEQQGGFLAAARQLAPTEAGGPVDREGVVAEDPETEFEDAADAAEPDEAPGSPPASGSGDNEDEIGGERAVDPAQVRSLLAGLTVKPRGDGGMVLEADRAAAGVLAEVLRGLAGAIEQAVGGAP